jgi:hypothetical protein
VAAVVLLLFFLLLPQPEATSATSATATRAASSREVFDVITSPPQVERRENKPLRGGGASALEDR